MSLPVVLRPEARRDAQEARDYLEALFGQASTGREGSMDLELESGRVIRGATEKDILSEVEGEDFAILGTGPNSYIQCAEQKEPPYEYVLEYQDGSLEAHFQAVDEPITLDRVLSAFLKYLRGDHSWRSDFRWEKMEL